MNSVGIYVKYKNTKLLVIAFTLDKSPIDNSAENSVTRCFSYWVIALIIAILQSKYLTSLSRYNVT